LLKTVGTGSSQPWPKIFGKFDIVFANIGISGQSPTGSIDEATFEDVVHTI